MTPCRRSRVGPTSPDKQLPAPAWRGSSSRCDSPWLLRERQAPLASSGLRRPRRQTPDDEAAPRHHGNEQPARAHMACSRRTPARATRRANSACARGALPARSPAREPARPRGVQPTRLRGMQPARPRGVRPARSSGVQPAPSGAPRRARTRDLQRLITTHRLSIRLRTKFAISRLASYLDRSVSNSGS